MEKNLLRYVLKHSKLDQITIVLVSFASFPLILAALYIPKLIVNEVLGEGSFPRNFLGIEFERLGFLFALCASLLVLIVLNNGLKYYLNIRKGLTGERMLRRMRFEFFNKIVRRPVADLKKQRPVEMVQAIVAELEPIGAFIGEIVATPVYQGGHLLVYLGFILMQDPILGLAAVILFPIQAYVIPIIQRRVVAHVQNRIKQVRRLTSELNDSLGSVEEMQLNGTSAFHAAQISSRLYTIFTIRYRIYVLKFAVKFANNVINHLVPFFFYAFGGYQVIHGRMDLGALVAIIAAYRDVASPWKELLRYYQTYSDITARYNASVDSFASGAEARELAPQKIDGRSLSLSGITTEASPTDGGVENVTLSIPAGAMVTFHGPDEIGREGLVRIVAGLEVPAKGSFQLGQDALGLDEMAVISGDVSFVAKSPMMISDTLRNNLTYGILADQASGKKPDDWNKRAYEARITGSVPDMPTMDWIDYARAGVSNTEELDRELVRVLKVVDLERVIFANGLSHRIPPGEEPELTAEILKLRAEIAQEPELPGASLLERFNPAAFMENATLFENIFFGCWDEPMTGRKAIDTRKDLRQAIIKMGLANELTEWGREAAGVIAELFGGLSSSPGLLERIDLVSPEDLETLQRVSTRAAARGDKKLSKKDQWFLIGLALDLRPIRHRLGVLDPPERRARALEARQTALKLDGFTRFDHSELIHGLSTIENIMVARPRLDRRDAKNSVEEILRNHLGESSGRIALVGAGMQEEITPGSDNLTAADRRAVALARGLLRRPKMLLIEALPYARPSRAAPLLKRIRESYPDMTLLVSLPDIETVGGIDQAYLVDNGHVTPIDPAALADREDHS